MQRHQPRGGVGQNIEMGGGRGPHGHGAALGIHLVIDEPPLLQEGVDPVRDRTNSTFTTKASLVLRAGGDKGQS